MSTLVARNLMQSFDQITDYWSPKIIGEVNDQYLKIAKVKGELVWHAHDEEDELFHIVKGSLIIEFEDHKVELSEGEFLTIPKGIMHNPIAKEECWVLLIESKSTQHTGNVVTEKTKTLSQQL